MALFVGGLFILFVLFFDRCDGFMLKTEFSGAGMTRTVIRLSLYQLLHS